ncbi:alpha/beta-hydrolase [Setomelanomma holmii]|uniref:Alpha/beta-hydrolase n=1 Tax=Setomelanomma holmii TaxID=210430 RepID=A0A9P4LN41_9PLEO|nr:alpha/beta-hydrolase [Setomelanomma holmii]
MTRHLPTHLEGNGGLTVDLGYARYQGLHNSTTTLKVWRGMRNAAPSTGHYQWTTQRGPETLRNQTIDASSFGPICPQSFASKDCLFLNVYVPPRANSNKILPVLVWIHGGGYGYGDGTQDMSETINANEQGSSLLLSSILGAFGFLSTSDVQEGGALNAGPLDVVFALEWVQKHIWRFGGDKRKDIISGESAGAGGVMLLGTAKGGTMGTSLFNKRYNDLAARVGCPGDSKLICLRAVDSLTLQQTNAAVTAAGTYVSQPNKALTAKKVNGCSLLVGNNAHEGVLFVPRTTTTVDDLTAWLKLGIPSFDDVDIQQVLAAYPISANTSYARFETSGIAAPSANEVSQLNDAYTSNGCTSYHYRYSVPFAAYTADIPAYFGPATPNQPVAFTTEEFPKWEKGFDANMLSLNTTGGTPYEVVTQSGATVTQFRDPGLQSNIKEVGASNWEGGRDKRCEFWRAIAARVPN